ncbi:uncharacterized protein LOC106172560 [Lingula anatina]|uniref:Complex I assembly factor TIMMDC1, mitochondrial n=1 Tax=Lingula anatina TaxID=7574 RepID=A0A1S3JF61_LINAN|nr:uncharacterized protein LOC106172560 [Lingula anatina]XP_013408786.1 uncharacterized protein LOC106172560 [Lingula anatina]|eukprot:XP_013408785.1 uncharacterized protein LOC106172560 [Lingula anatina]
MPCPEGKTSTAFQLPDRNKYYRMDLDIKLHLRKHVQVYSYAKFQNMFHTYKNCMGHFNRTPVNLINGTSEYIRWNPAQLFKKIRFQHVARNLNFFPVAYAQGKNDVKTTETNTSTSAVNSTETVSKATSSGVVSQDVATETKPDSKYAVREEDVDAYMAQETGWDRVKFYYTEKEVISEDNPMTMHLAKNALVAFIFGLVVGATKSSKEAAEKFIKKHQTYKFQSNFAAQTALAESIRVHSLVGGTKTGFKFFLFILCFEFLSQSINIYFNSCRFYHYTLSAGMTGGLAMFYKGPVAMAYGAVQGAVLGTLYGLINFRDIDLINMHRDEVRALLQSRKQAEAKAAGL